MKKLLLIVFCCLLSSHLAIAQTRAVFSSALTGGATYTSRGVRQDMYRPNAPAAAPANRTITTKRTVIKYDPSQLAIREVQTEKLAPLFKRLQNGQIKSIELVGVARQYLTAYHRLHSLSKVIKAYSGVKIRYRYITGPAVLKSNDNTVEIIEYR